MNKPILFNTWTALFKQIMRTAPGILDVPNPTIKIQYEDDDGAKKERTYRFIDVLHGMNEEIVLEPEQT